MRQQPDVVVGATIHGAWRACAERLLADGDRFNLVAHVREPGNIDGAALKHLDPRSVDAGVMSVFDVATTIFPRRSARWALAPTELAAHYLPIYERLKRRNRTGWGFYFQRLTQFGSTKAPQLERIVHGLGGWGRRHRGAFVIHTSSAELDRPRPLGAPCWQYGQFMADGGVLSLTAAYRSHDYFSKALGNFVGLSRLLSYVCEKTGHTIGTLTCLSTYAFLGSHKTSTMKLLKAKAMDA